MLATGFQEIRVTKPSPHRCVIAAWNAVADGWNNSYKFVREILACLEAGPKQAKIVMKRLLEGKAKFSADLRAV
jgi:hypothetical protein